MLLSKLLTSFCFAVMVSADAAPVSRDSPLGVVYEATFTQGEVRGFVRFYSRSGYARYYIDVRGLPATGGPFDYHIHQRRVPPTGNCRGTLGDFNPYDGVPNAPTLAEYEVGDLSGKHGVIRGRTYRRVFLDVYMSLNPRNPAFIGDLSVVIHRLDGSRLACTNMRRIAAKAGEEPENVDVDDKSKVDNKKVDNDDKNVDNVDVDRKNVDNVDKKNVDNVDVDKKNVDNVDVDKKNVDNVDVDKKNVDNVDVDKKNVDNVDVDKKNVDNVDVDRKNVDNVDVDKKNVD